MHVRFEQSDIEQLHEMTPEIKDLEFPKIHKSKISLPDSITAGEYRERHKNTIISEEFADSIENAQKNWSKWTNPWL